MKLNDLPKEEKPRERLIKYGAKNISNEDLISIILRTGSKNINVKELSNVVLSKIKNIEDLDNIGFNELTSIKGMGKVKTISLLASIELGKRVSNKTFEEGIVINTTKLVHNYFASTIANKTHEELLVILLDNKQRLIDYNVMYKGTSSETLASPKEIFNYAIKERAAGVIIMHNHPSGIVYPSEADITLTETISQTGKIIGIPLLDHIITNGKNYYSFFDESVKNEA